MAAAVVRAASLDTKVVIVMATAVVSAASLDTKIHSVAPQALTQGQQSRWQQDNAGHAVSQALEIAGGYSSLLRGATNTLAAEEFVALENGAATLMAIDSSLGTLLDQREQQQHVLLADELPVDKALRVRTTSSQDWVSFLEAQCVAHLLDTWMKASLLFGMVALLMASMTGYFNMHARCLQVGGRSSSNEKHARADALLTSTFHLDAGNVDSGSSKLPFQTATQSTILKSTPMHFRLDEDQDVLLEEAEADVPEFQMLPDEEEVPEYHLSNMDDDALSFYTEADAERSFNPDLVSELDHLGFYSEPMAEYTHSAQVPDISATAPTVSSIGQAIQDAAETPPMPVTMLLASAIGQAIPHVVDTLVIPETLPLATTRKRAISGAVEPPAIPAMLQPASTAERAAGVAATAIAQEVDTHISYVDSCNRIDMKTKQENSSADTSYAHSTQTEEKKLDAHYANVWLNHKEKDGDLPESPCYW